MARLLTPIDIAAMVAEGREVDWPAALDAAAAQDRPLLEQLRVMASVAQSTGAMGDDEPLPRAWGPFEVIAPIGRGSYGVVLRARDTRVDREVALKLLPASAGREERRFFLEEARALARVRHPNVVSVYGADEFGGVPGLWMELVEGLPLDEALARDGPLSARETAIAGLDLCSALSAVHAAGLVHRDIKTGNVVREVGGRIVLMDFGAVQLAAPARTAMGTPLFMAPELFEGAPASASTDLYALGVVLFTLATGEFPVEGMSIDAIRTAHRDGGRRLARDVRPALSASLASVLDRAVSPDPRERFGSAASMQRALAAALDLGLGSRRPARAVPLWMALVIALVAASAGLAGGWFARITTGDDVARRLTDGEWAVVNGHRDLGHSRAEAGNWTGAASALHTAATVFHEAYGPLTAAAAFDVSSAAFATARGGDRGRAEEEYTSVLFALAGAAGEGHPLAAAVETARATDARERGHFEQGAAAAIRALRVRARMLGLDPGEEQGVPGWNVGILARALASHRIDTDADADWLPDAIEVAAGLDPNNVDTHGDGVRDGERDANANGVADGLEWGLVADPNRVVGSFGSADPVNVGARVLARGRGTPVRLAGTERQWDVRSSDKAAYVMALTDQQKRWAAQRGWRLMLRAQPIAGQTYATVDLLPHGRQFAISAYAAPGRPPIVRLVSQTMPRVSLDFDFPTRRSAPLLVLDYDPVRGTARFVSDGEVKTVDYGGLGNLQAGRGLVWGVTNNLGDAPVAEGRFELVALEIR